MTGGGGRRDLGDSGIVFVDCAAESPKGRRSLCYDGAEGEQPEGSAAETAAAMEVELLDEEAYRALQRLGKFDPKTSSWLRMPDDVRTPGWAIFGDRCHVRVFVFHNGADSYYASRGFAGGTIGLGIRDSEHLILDVGLHALEWRAETL